MKQQISQFTCLLSIAMLMFSCASQNHIDFVGHYKPNTEVRKSPGASVSEHDVVQKISLTANQPLTADAAIPEPDLKMLTETIQRRSTPSDKMQHAKVEKLEKKLNKLAEKSLRTKLEAQQTNKSSVTHKEASSSTVGKVLLIILCFLLPPLAVGLAKGIGWPFWLSLILTLCFWIPGVIYALIVILGD